MTSELQIRGWDLIYKLIENELYRKEDVLIAFIHLVLIHCDYRCIGLGEEKNISGNEKSSELLPPEWNLGDSFYCIRYVKNGKLFILKAAANNDIIVNLLETKKLVINSIVFNVQETVKSLKGDTIKDLIPNYNKVLKTVVEDLLKLDQESSTKPQATKDNEKPEVNERSTKLSVNSIHRSIQVDTVDLQSRFDFFDYGRTDIMYSPGVDQGGLLFNPIAPTGSRRDTDSRIPNQLPGMNLPPATLFDVVDPTNETIVSVPLDSDELQPENEDIL